MAKPGEIRLGQLLIRKRICTLRQVNEALRAQQDQRDQGVFRPLGWILIESGHLTDEQLRQALAEMGVLELVCPACREANAIASYSPSAEYRCPRCRALLVLDDPSSPIAPSIKGAAAPYLDAVPAAAETTGDDPMISKVIGGCQVIERIARGGMGVVYKARQLNLNRIVAVKILSEDLAKDKTYVHRFVEEARSAAVLSHGNIVHVNDVGEHNGIFYFIMEFIEGENLREVLNRVGVLDVPRALDIALQVAHALQHAHRRGIVHRDIKPENIMVTREGTVKLADMGLAKKIVPGSGVGLTHAGAILGTPFYMAPEQARDFSQVDPRSDIYSLGVTLYRALTGKVPFDGRSPIEVMVKAIDGRHPTMRDLRPEIPPEVDALVERMIDREPDKRIQEAGELIAAIRDIQVKASRPPAAAVPAAQ